MKVGMTITGIQKAQAKNLRRIMALEPQGELGELVREVTAFTHRQAVAITHIDTGALRASHRLDVIGLRGRVYLDPSAINPRSGAKVREYGEYEHERGGSHAFYARAKNATSAYLSRVAKQLQRRLAAGV